MGAGGAAWHVSTHYVHRVNTLADVPTLLYNLCMEFILFIIIIIIICNQCWEFNFFSCLMIEIIETKF